MSLRLALLASGRYISCIPTSSFHYGGQGRLKVLPLDTNLKLPITILKLKIAPNSPVVQVFVEQAREPAKAMAKQSAKGRASTDRGRQERGRCLTAPDAAAVGDKDALFSRQASNR